jgi:AraC family transcriptional regulator
MDYGFMSRPDLSTAPVSHLAVDPPAVVHHQSADWGLVQAEQVDIIRHEPFSYEFKGPRHLLVASERAERYDGETLVDGLPLSFFPSQSPQLNQPLFA